MEERKTYPLTRAQEGIVALADMLQTIDSLQLIAHVDFRSEMDEALLIEAIAESGASAAARTGKCAST